MPSLPRNTQQGVDADAFLTAAEAHAEVETHSLMVVRDGAVVAERWWAPYAPDRPHLLYSLSKSFTSTALGFAVAEGRVDLDATVLSYFPEYDREVTDERTRSMRVRHVAAMASGHEDETVDRAMAAGEGDLLLGFLRTPPEREPGSVFAYNQPCSYAVSAIVQRVSGGTLTDFLRPRLWEPLGIEAYGWRRDRLGRELGYAGLYTTTESIAKLGLLYLNHGEWAGRRLLPAEWVAEATRSHIVPERDQPDWRQGYGFQFWHSRHGYRGDGAFGQFLLILPEAGAVVAMTGQSPDMQAVLDEAWTHLLPALATGGAAAAPPAAAPALPVPAGEPGPLPEGVFTGDAVVSTAEIGGGRLVLTGPGGPVTAALGAPGSWTGDGPLHTGYAWSDGRLRLDVVFSETPHRLHLTLDPDRHTCAARWATEPIGDPALAKLRMP